MSSIWLLPKSIWKPQGLCEIDRVTDSLLRVWCALGALGCEIWSSVSDYFCCKFMRLLALQILLLSFSQAWRWTYEFFSWWNDLRYHSHQHIKKWATHTLTEEKEFILLSATLYTLMNGKLPIQLWIVLSFLTNISCNLLIWLSVWSAVLEPRTCMYTPFIAGFISGSVRREIRAHKIEGKHDLGWGGAK